MKASFLRGLFFFIFVLAVSAYAFYEYTQVEKTETKEKEQSALFLYSLNDLKKISLKNQKETFVLVHESGNWKLKEPLEDTLDLKDLSDWFNQLKQEHLVNVKSSKPIDWDAYDLDGSFILELSLKSGEIKSFSISSKSTFDGKYFVKKENSLFLGSSFLGQGGFNKSKEDLRSKEIIHSFGHPKKIILKASGTLNKKGESLVLEWKNYKWSIQDEKNFPLDGNRLDGFWTDLSSLKAKRIVSSVSRSELRKHGLYRNFFKIVLLFDGEQKSTIRINSLKSTGAFILNSNRKYILEISKEDAKKLILSREDLRKKPIKPLSKQNKAK